MKLDVKVPSLAQTITIVVVAALGMKFVVPQLRKLPVVGQAF